jgi:hypothetical protein
LPCGIDEPLSRSPSRQRRTPAGGGLPRAHDGQHAKRFLHDHSLTLDETGKANFALVTKTSKQLATLQPYYEFRRLI